MADSNIEITAGSAMFKEGVGESEGVTDSVESMPMLHLDNQLCFSLYSLSRLVTQGYTPLLKPLDLTYPQYLVMLVLWQSWEEGQLSLPIGHLTHRLKLDTGTVTPLLKRMEVKGLLARTRSDQDERIVLVALTEKGTHLREKASAVPGQLLCRSEANAEQITALRERLKEMMSLLN